MFIRDKNNHPLVYCKKNNKLKNITEKIINASFFGTYEIEGNKLVPAFELIAKEFLNDDYKPSNISSKIDINETVIKRIASEIAETAFEKEITLPIEWIDINGNKHDKMIGRPVSMHAMRGISAHSNGFETCRLIHVLQMLIGSIDSYEV